MSSTRPFTNVLWRQIVYFIRINTKIVVLVVHTKKEFDIGVEHKMLYGAIDCLFLRSHKWSFNELR